MNFDRNGMTNVPSEVIKHMMEQAPAQEKRPVQVKEAAFAPCSPYRQYKGSFTVESKEKHRGRIATVYVKLEANDREEALMRLRTYAEAENPEMNCSRFQVSPAAVKA